MQQKLFTLVVLTIILLCTLLGFWQLSRAQQKKTILESYTQRTQAEPLHAEALNSEEKMRFYRTTLLGYFDNEHPILLDNKIFHGRVGYEIYTPFHAKNLKDTILIDRGFIPAGQTRQVLPSISPILGEVRVIGLLNKPPAYFALGNMTESTTSNWPLRIQFLDLVVLGKVLKTPLFPYIVSLEPHHTAAYPIEWQIVTIGPERHLAYAVQWFALALALLISFAVYQRRQ